MQSTAQGLLVHRAVNTTQAFFAGVIGTAVAIVVVGASRAAGIDVGFEDSLGEAWAVRLGLVLLAGGLVALAYGIGFERLGSRLDIRWLALAFGVVHAALALHLFVTVGGLRSVAATGGPTFQLPVLAVLVSAHLAFAMVTGILYRSGVDRAEPAEPPLDLAGPLPVPVRRKLGRAA